MTSDANDPTRLTVSGIFECRQCGECCRGYGGTLINQNDILAISSHIGVSPDDFVRDYCARSGSGLVISQGENGYCLFAREALCRIHPVKPRMCKAWPFIEGVLRDPGNWYIMAGVCPGIRTDVSEKTIRRCVEAAMGDFEEKRRGG